MAISMFDPGRDEPEALCVCKETQVACGSNNRTYDSVCQMNQELADSGFPDTLYLKHWGPCRSVPWIISGPQDVGSSLGQGLALDCEVKGYPIPSIHWEFKADDGTSRMLPSDDLYMAVQVRGGPEPYMATSWVQIVSLRHKDTGTYTCVATNTEGVVRASAQKKEKLRLNEEYMEKARESDVQKKKELKRDEELRKKKREGPMHFASIESSTETVYTSRTVRRTK
uniref:Uncharacterized protein n=1 Tax=Timema monikensis TaxID=170555 RepID=A0A7R9EB93_9NEOP|nr:unnamed protein product [Timema monikensis]